MVWASGTCNLFLQSEDPTPTEDSLDLVITGVAGSGFAGGIDLTVCCGDDGNVLGASLPVTMPIGASAPCVRNVNLFIGGGYHYRSRAADLTLWNTQQGTADAFDLFIAGSGVTADAMPFDAGLNLSLRRWPAAAVDLFVCAPGAPLASGSPLTLLGSAAASGSVPLSFHSAIGAQSSGVTLYTCGW